MLNTIFFDGGGNSLQLLGGKINLIQEACGKCRAMVIPVITYVTKHVDPGYTRVDLTKQPLNRARLVDGVLVRPSYQK